MSYGMRLTSLLPSWQRYHKQASVALARELPQIITQPWHVKIRRYWDTARNVSWFLELQNSAPLIHDETEFPLVLYREPWNGDVSLLSSDRTKSVFVQALVQNLLTAMLEGGTLGAMDDDRSVVGGSVVVGGHHRRSALDSMMQSKRQYFEPRRPGILAVDPKLECCLPDIRAAIEAPLNILVFLFADSDGTMDEQLKKKYETVGNTYIETSVGESPGLKIRCLDKSERKKFFDEYINYENESQAVSSMCPNPLEFLEEETPWMELGYNSLEEAVEAECASQDPSDKEQKREYLGRIVHGWENYGYESLLDASMQEFDAKTPEEAIWDYFGVPRLLAVDDEKAGDKLNSAGWHYEGYKAGRDFDVSEKTIKKGARVVHDEKFHAWTEPGGRRY